MIHLYSKNGTLSMWSRAPIDAPDFQHDEIEDTALQDLKDNRVDRFENGQLVYKDQPISSSPSVEELKKMIEHADKETLKSIVNQIVLKLS